MMHLNFVDVYRSAYILGLSLTLSRLLQTVMGDTDCPGQTLKECFVQNGIEAPSFPKSTGGDNNGGYVDSIIMKSPEEFCQTKTQFKSAFYCAMTATAKCYPPELSGYLPQPDMMSLFLDRLCENVTVKDGECIQSKQDEIQTCIDVKKRNIMDQMLERPNISQLVCTQFVFYTHCLKVEASSCGCNITDLYQHLLGDLLYPPSCPRPMVTADIACGSQVALWSSYVILHISFWFLCVFVIM